MKKVLVILVLIVLVITGCGKVASNVQDFGETSRYTEQTPAEGASTESFVNDLKAVFGAQLSAAAEEGTSREVSAEQTSFGVESAAQEGSMLMSIGYDEAYAYWSYQQTNKNTGFVQESIEGKYRYYDKRTGLPFDKPAVHFNKTDVANIDYMERVERSTGVYPQYPASPVYKTYYHEKIIFTPNKVVVSLFPGKISTMNYIGLSTSEIVLTSMNISYDLPQKSTGAGFYAGKGTGVYSAYTFKMDLTISGGVTNGTMSVYRSGLLVATIYFPGDSQNIETKYYIGVGYYYTTITAGLISGLEDNVIFELQNSVLLPYPGLIIDGTKPDNKLGSRLKNLKITAKQGQRAAFSTLVYIKNIDGVELTNINFNGGLSVVNCTNVVKNNVSAIF